MKAMTYETFGDPSVLSLTDQPLPKVGPGEVLVKVHAAGVNPVDWKAMSGGLDSMIEAQFPAIPGWDVAGTVAAKGIDSPGVEEGDEVIAYARKDWIHGGTFAEYVSVPLRALAPKPQNLTWEQAAGLPLAGLTAYQVLTRSGLEEGKTVLIHGASGGVGSMGVQIAAAAGARVIGTASEKNHDYLRQLGAEPVEYGEGLAGRVRELAPDGVDIVADFVGGVLDTTLEVLAEDGVHASIADPEAEKNGGAWMWVVPSAEDLTRLGDLVERGKLSVKVDAVYPLDRLPAAFEKSQEGRTVGKIVLQVSGD
ncbi:NADP-dependent oxidoreductase [Rothia halotolerans]|uniref:NADP-dependent oxidoreductase n=1 Tax=Rothia halotolerans TaxID=405770 RepID=UPI001875305E|nr:NADP-dependent oxidoreductase [Rothia halotolerans]